ncbi:MAG: hypothetical protein HC895_26575 [Leptolyngbyaceae cyanobacterium SM1_3_5]|nr:hypothetical protein [Leptolyngbyaceae cyanobacterium SM1_3_5]
MRLLVLGNSIDPRSIHQNKLKDTAMFNRQFAFIPLTFALLLMNYSEPQKQADAIDECAGVAQEQLEAIASEISQQHEPAIVTEYLKYYCQGYQAGQRSGGGGVAFFLMLENEGYRLSNLFMAAYHRGADAACGLPGCGRIPTTDLWQYPTTDLLR